MYLAILQHGACSCCILIAVVCGDVIMHVLGETTFFPWGGCHRVVLLDSPLWLLSCFVVFIDRCIREFWPSRHFACVFVDRYADTTITPSNTVMSHRILVYIIYITCVTVLLTLPVCSTVNCNISHHNGGVHKMHTTVLYWSPLFRNQGFVHSVLTSYGLIANILAVNTEYH